MNKAQEISSLQTIISELYEQKQITKQQFDQCSLNLENNNKKELTNNSNTNLSIKDILSIFIKASCNRTHNVLSEEQIKQQKINSFKSLQDSEQKLTTNNKISGTQNTIDSATTLLENFSHLSLDKIDIEDFETNLLDLDKSLYVPFVYKVLNNIPYFQSLDINTQKLTNFLDQLQKKYQKHNNPYHNYIHGLTVMHSCYILGKMKKAQKILSSMDYFALVFSGLCHDVGHTGFNNDFEIKTLSKKALRWNDKSVLENYHAYTTFKLLLKPKNNFLKDLNKKQFNLFRKRAIDNILATDMKDHHSSLFAFQSKINTPDFEVKSQSNISILSGFIIHSSDLSTSVKKVQTSQLWTVKINLQFSNQYRQQQLLGISLSSFMKDLDINRKQAAQSQISFCNNFVKPLYKCLDSFQNSQITKNMLKNLQESVIMYQRQIEQEQNKN